MADFRLVATQLEQPNLDPQVQQAAQQFSAGGTLPVGFIIQPGVGVVRAPGGTTTGSSATASGAPASTGAPSGLTTVGTAPTTAAAQAVPASQEQTLGKLVACTHQPSCWATTLGFNEQPPVLKAPRNEDSGESSLTLTRPDGVTIKFADTRVKQCADTIFAAVLALRGGLSDAGLPVYLELVRVNLADLIQVLRTPTLLIPQLFSRTPFLSKRFGALFELPFYFALLAQWQKQALHNGAVYVALETYALLADFMAMVLTVTRPHVCTFRQWLFICLKALEPHALTGITMAGVESDSLPIDSICSFLALMRYRHPDELQIMDLPSEFEAKSQPATPSRQASGIQQQQRQQQQPGNQPTHQSPNQPSPSGGKRWCATHKWCNHTTDYCRGETKKPNNAQQGPPPTLNAANAPVNASADS